MRRHTDVGVDHSGRNPAPDLPSHPLWPPAPSAQGVHTRLGQTGRMRIELTTEPGDPDRPDEDYASVALPASGQGGSLVLLDGVTPPSGDAGCSHTVPWFTARLGGALGELSVSRRDLTLSEILAAAIARTADTHRDTCDLSHPRTPQATVVLARWDAERVEHRGGNEPDELSLAHLDPSSAATAMVSPEERDDLIWSVAQRLVQKGPFDEVRTVDAPAAQQHAEPRSPRHEDQAAHADVEEEPDGFRILVRDSPAMSATGTFASLIGDIATQVEHILADEFKRRGYETKLAPLYSHALVGMVALVGEWWLDEGKPKRSEVASHLVNLAWNGLGSLDPHPVKTARRAAKGERGKAATTQIRPSSTTMPAL